MSPAWESFAQPVPRLLEAAWARAGERAMHPMSVGVMGPAWAGGGSTASSVASDTILRWIVMSWIGAHPDARDPLLAALWQLEEGARATGLPTLVLRLAPLIGPQGPLLALLAQRPVLDARLSRAVIQPVLEADVVEGLARFLDGSAEWNDWYEVCGPDAISVGELAGHAQAGRFGTATATRAWEPPPAVLRAQGLSESDAWARATGVLPRSVLALPHQVPA